MITINKINTSSPYYEWAEALWTEAFPEEERRETEAQRSNADNNPVFNYMLAMDGDEPIGLFTYWDFGDFIYCEHFATSAGQRSKGYGSAIIRQIIEHAGKPLVLEVEMPENELSRRRIGFYEREGLHLWRNSKYVQPPYRKGGESLPMLLMATDGLDELADFGHVATTLHKKVYGV